METFGADWLALREPVDHRSRAHGLADRLTEWWASSECSRVVDLGSGTGSNQRYLSPLLSGHQEWILVDHDRDLLARATAPAADVTLEIVQGDLMREGLDWIAGANVVTASALLDLTSSRWTDALATHCAAAEAAALFALSYDGSIQWSGRDGAARRSDPLDSVIQDAVNQHQRRDKGLGAALGPDAAAVTEAAFRSHGYLTWLEASAWELGAEEAPLARLLVAGWAQAATEEQPELADSIRQWAARRESEIDSGAFTLTVGHVDLLALPNSAAPADS